MSTNDLADRLDEHAAYDLLTPEDVDTMRAAAALLREQAEQLDALRNAIEAHRTANTSNCNNLSCEKGCGHDLRLYAALDGLAAAGGGVPEEGATDE